MKSKVSGSSVKLSLHSFAGFTIYPRVLTKCFPLSFCSAFVPVLYYLYLFLHVFSVMILTTGGFSCISRFLHVPLQILFIFPSIKMMDSVLILLTQPSSCLSSFLDQRSVFFNRQLTVWAQWYSSFLFFNFSLQLYAFKSVNLTKRLRLRNWLWSLSLESTLQNFFLAFAMSTAEGFSASPSLAWQHCVKLSKPI